MLLERLRRSPEARGRARLGTVHLEFEKLRHFSGLTTKVRHNDVRLKLPFTFKLLDHLGLSIELFASYAKPAAALRKLGKNRPLDKISSLIAFLGGWLDPRSVTHAILWDLARHEHAIIESQLVAGEAAQEAGPTRTTVSMKSLLCHRGRVIRHELSCDPVEVVRRLSMGGYDLPAVQGARRHFAYSWDSQRQRVIISQVDEIGVILLDLVDGRRSVMDITKALRDAGIPLDGKVLCRALQVLVNGGLLTLTQVERASCA